jgi:hypothetical protein
MSSSCYSHPLNGESAHTRYLTVLAAASSTLSYIREIPGNHWNISALSLAVCMHINNKRLGQMFSRVQASNLWTVCEVTCEYKRFISKMVDEVCGVRQRSEVAPSYGWQQVTQQGPQPCL